MTFRQTRRTMSIRKWLVLALVSLFVVPFMTLVLVSVILFAPQGGPRSVEEELRETIVRDAARWNDPRWQARLQDNDAEADVVLMVGGEETFRTGDPFATDTTRMVHRITVPDSDPVQTALLYSTNVSGPPEAFRESFLPLFGFGALILTLIAITWFLRQSVIQPLEATSNAAHRVARGELDIVLPTSQVREVAQLSHAFESMSEDLRASHARRTALEEERRLFVTAIAHDLRTPLFSLRGSLEGLERGIATSPEQRARYLRIATDKANQLEHLIADLFTYTRMEYMGEAPSTTDVDITGLLRDIVDGVQPRADERAITLSLDTSRDPLMIEADEHLLRRAIENIVDNALRHTPENGTIRIEAGPRDGMTAVTVTDSGPGFAEHDIPHLFEPLYRGEASRSRKTGGAGLGLTIAHRIVTAHGGALMAGNDPGAGAQLTITLPG